MKDPIETVCRTILGFTGDTVGTEPMKLHALVKRTMLHLGIDPTQIDEHTRDAIRARIAKQILDGIASLLQAPTSCAMHGALGSGAVAHPWSTMRSPG